MDSNYNPTSNSSSAMPTIPTPPAPAPVVPTPSDAMPTINPYVDNTPAPEPAVSSVPTFSSSNPAANAAPVIPTTSSTPTSFGLNNSSEPKQGFDPSSVASFFTPEAPSYSNGGIIAATEPITEPDPIPEPDPIEEELKAPFKAAAPVPGSIGSAISVAKDAVVEVEKPREEKKKKKEKPAPKKAEASAEIAVPALNPNNPFLNQNRAPEPAPAAPAPIAPEPVATPAVAPAPVAEPAPMMQPVAPVIPESPVAPAPAAPAPVAPAPIAPEPVATPVVAPAPVAEPAPMMQTIAPEAPAMSVVEPTPVMNSMEQPMIDPMAGQVSVDNPEMQFAPAPPVPGFDLNSLPMPSEDMNAPQVTPLAYDPASAQMNPFMEAAAMNADANLGSGPAKADNKKKLFIIGAAAAAVVLIAIIAIFAMGGGSSKPKVADNPTPAPTPAKSTDGTVVCTRSYSKSELSKYPGAITGKSNVTIVYKNEEVKNIISSETIDFDNDNNSKSAAISILGEYTDQLEKLNVVNDENLTSTYSYDNATAIASHTLTITSKNDAGLVKLFGLVSGGDDDVFVAEDTIAGYEEKEFTCNEKGTTGGGEEEEIEDDFSDEEPSRNEDEDSDEELEEAIDDGEIEEF